jgi:DNA primase
MGWVKRDLVDIAVEHVPDLREINGENGIYYQGCCPFHDDSSPSFYIYPNEGPENARWVCFSHCGQGDVIDFVQRIYDISFKEALKIATDIADDADVALAMAKKNFSTPLYDFSLLSMRMKKLMDRLDFAYASRVYFAVDAAAAQADYGEIERILRKYDI